MECFKDEHTATETCDFDRITISYILACICSLIKNIMKATQIK